MKKTVDSYYWNRNESLRNVPKWLDLEINTNCNKKCKKCFRQFYIPKTEFIDLDFAKKIINEFAQKGGESIRFIERGEPTLSPILVDVVKYSHNLGLRTMINTNCVVLTFDLSRKLIEAGISTISCNIDSSVKETYKILQGNHYDDVIKNIKSLYKLAKNSDTVIEIHMNKQKENSKEADSNKYYNFFIQYAHKVNIDRTYNISNFNEIEILETEACAEPWRRLIVLVDGRVILCPAGINYRTEEIFEVGNLHKNSLQEIWLNEKMKRIREAHRSGRMGEVYKPCRSCRLRRYINGE